MFFSIFLPQNLVSSEKSSTFAPDLRLRLANLKNGENHTEKTQCWKSATYEESDEKMQKVAKKFGQSKKKQYLCSRFRAKRKMSAKSQWSLRDWSNNVVQESKQLLNWETENV